MRKIGIPFVVVAILSIVNCSYHPFVPPGEIISISTPATLNKNQFSISGAFGNSSELELFGYSLNNSWIKLNYGLTNSIELSISSSGIFLEDTEKTFVDYKRYSLGGYVSSKVSLIPKILSINGGIGIGFSDLGNYSNIDVGIIWGWENKIIVPLGQIDMFLGLPFNPQNHDLSLLSDEPQEFMYKPESTIGLKVNTGAKFPVLLWLGKNDKFSIYLVYGLSEVWDSKANDQFLSFGGSVEYKF
ncbi:MAG: hypothetical protein WBM07_14035 [Chitinivibrionales bacterium]